MTEVLLLKQRVLHALEHKLQADIDDYDRRGKPAKARALKAAMPLFLLPQRQSGVIKNSP
jgi:hypothetical protein